MNAYLFGDCKCPEAAHSPGEFEDTIGCLLDRASANLRTDVVIDEMDRTKVGFDASDQVRHLQPRLPQPYHRQQSVMQANQSVRGRWAGGQVASMSPLRDSLYLGS